MSTGFPPIEEMEAEREALWARLDGVIEQLHQRVETGKARISYLEEQLRIEQELTQRQWENREMRQLRAENAELKAKLLKAGVQM